MTKTIVNYSDTEGSTNNFMQIQTIVPHYAVASIHALEITEGKN
jgi:hypothetical protein